MLRLYYLFFFFQAEDGIRDYKVTGVQTCALPILGRRPDGHDEARVWRDRRVSSSSRFRPRNPTMSVPVPPGRWRDGPRSEERRVGKVWRSRWAVEQCE